MRAPDTDTRPKFSGFPPFSHLRLCDWQCQPTIPLQPDWEGFIATAAQSVRPAKPFHRPAKRNPHPEFSRCGSLLRILRLLVFATHRCQAFRIADQDGLTAR